MRPTKFPNLPINSQRIIIFPSRQTKLGLVITIFILMASLFHTNAQTLNSNKVKATYGDWGIETQFINKSVSPGTDFYTYVNDGWLKSTTIPAGASGFNSFIEAKNKINKQLADII